jgi:hypothetical protein
MRKIIAICGMFLAALLSQSAFAAGYALFDAPTDTIWVDGDSVIGTAMTIEARVNLNVNVGTNGSIYNEWVDGEEDKHLMIMPGQTMYGYLYHPGGTAPLLSSATVSLNAWHHLAYVYDGSQERLYLDGSKVASRPASGDVLDFSYSMAAVGAIFRDAHIVASFEGLIDTLRFSTIARYTGDSFTAPTGDLTSDAYTNLLYNFNEPQDSTIVYDLSGNGRDGYLGFGDFDGATSPTFIPEPCTLMLLGLGVAIFGKKKPAE